MCVRRNTLNQMAYRLLSKSCDCAKSILWRILILGEASRSEKEIRAMKLEKTSSREKHTMSVEDFWGSREDLVLRMMQTWGWPREVAEQKADEWEETFLRANQGELDSRVLPTPLETD